MSSAENYTGTKEKEVNGTVQEFLERHSEKPVFMMTPGGYVYLVPEQIENLLSGKPVAGSPYTWRECVQIVAEELLKQKVDSMNHVDGTWYVLTRINEPEVVSDRAMRRGWCVAFKEDIGRTKRGRLY